MIIFFLCNSISVHCQDWLSINPKGISYFSNSGMYIAIRIDSTSVYGDTAEYYSYKMLRQTDNYYFTAKGDPWIGEKLMVVPNGWNLFFNYNKDTIKINNLAKLNESWKMYNFPNKNYVIAEVYSIDTMSFLNIIDSVKHISLTTKDSNDVNVESFINNLELILSKKHGFVNILNFYQFPFDQESILFPHLDASYRLAGMSDHELGYQNITFNDIYNNDIGDELHWGYSGISYFTQTETKYIDKIIDKNVYTDSIVFTIDRCYKSVRSNYSSSEIDTGKIKTKYIINHKNSIQSLLDYLPYEICCPDNNDSYYYIIEAIKNGKLQCPLCVFTGLYPDLLQFPIVDPAPCQINYYKGIGGGYGYCEGWFMGDYSDKYVI